MNGLAGLETDFLKLAVKIQDKRNNSPIDDFMLICKRLKFMEC